MSSYLNNYTAPSADIARDCHLHTPLEEYDHNYIFEVKPLRSDRVEMRPFIPSMHAQLLFDGLTADPDIARWLSMPPLKELNDVLSWAERVFRRNPDAMLLAIFSGPTDASAPPVDPSEYAFAGVMAFIASSKQHLTIEPGWIMIMKPFQRTHLLTHAAGLAMHRILDMPSEGGLGLRRCQWTTTTLNTASQNAAKRLGFTHEGVLRCQWVLPPGKEGVRPGRKGDAFENGMQRDNWFASVIFEDWENGVREHVDKLMARR